MSGNNAYTKSMNGIVSFDTNGTTIEGDNITSGTIDCNILNSTNANCDELSASVSVFSPFVKTDFILSDTSLTFNSPASTSFSFSVPTALSTENSTIAASTAYVTSAISTLKSGNPTVSWNGTHNFTGANLRCTTKTTGTSTTDVATTAFATTTTSDAITAIKAGATWTGLQNFSGVTTISVPTRPANDATSFAANCTYVNTAIANVLNGTSYTGAQDFTGATLTAFTQSALDNSTKVATTAYTTTALVNFKAAANIWTQAQDFTSATLTAFTQTSTDTSTKVATTAYVTSAFTTLKAGATWTGTQNFTGSTITATTQAAGDNSTKVATTAFVLANAGSSSLLGLTNTWSGVSNTFNNVVNFGLSTAPQLKIYSNRIESTSGSDTISFGSNTTGGNIEIGKTLTGGSIILANNFRFIIDAGTSTLHFRTLAVADIVSFCSNLTSGSLTLAGGLTSGIINIGTGALTDLSSINIGTGAGATANPIKIGGAGSITTINGKLNIGTTRTFGYTSYVIHNGASGNYTITNANIDIDFYIVMIGTVNCSLLLNATIPGQRVYIRNAMGAGNINNVITPAGTNIIRAGGGITSFLTMTENTGIMFLCDGATWIVMMAYP